MARLSEQEANLLKKLQAKAEAPDAPPVNRSVSVSIDLGDEKQVARAIKLGFLDSDDDEDGAGAEGEGGEGEADTPPKRRGYFNE